MAQQPLSEDTKKPMVSQFLGLGIGKRPEQSSETGAGPVTVPAGRFPSF